MAILPQRVAELVQRFDANRDAYRSGQYNETQLRREFLDPFFEELGWDVTNKQGYAESYKDVVHEDSLKIGATTKAPDYCFRVGGTRKFFVEAKRPSVNIREEVAPSYQLRRYAWSAKLALSVLTDFEEFAVFDCRIRPNQGDKASTARTFYCTYRDYATKWFDISAVFSREAVLKGSFDKYADVTKTKRGTQTVDAAFLDEIEHWRERLAKNLALRNKSLGPSDLNFAVQRTIDRIVFLRICEDRGVEAYGRLQALTDGGDIYVRLCQLFDRADKKYNSGLFHFAVEADRAEIPDRLTPALRIDDDALRDVLASLYYPASPYEFSVVSTEILGHVYERFLGKVIRLTPGHQAKIEEKPEVRKAGGVYYTPSFIVDHIVKATLDKLLVSKTPKEARAIKILDPACGSGSFLLGAFQALLDWHRAWYVADGPEKHARTKTEEQVAAGNRKRSKHAKARTSALFRDRFGEWQLTTAKRKEILLNNVFGVDLDAQAVEVTKLSLLLKVLEGETEEALNKSLKLFEERALPDLGRNIQCGNSLIDADYYSGDDAHGDDETNPFDWRQRFASIFENGGFDAVIGNPPYLSYGGRQIVDIPKAHTEYFERSYECAGWATAHSFFMERAVKLLAKRFVSFIVPDQVGHLDGYRSLRGVLLRHASLVEVKYWGEHVFDGVTTPSLTFVLDKAAEVEQTSVLSVSAAEQTGLIEGDAPWTFERSGGLLAKLRVRTMTIRPYIADCGVRTTDSKKQVVPLDQATGRFIPTLEGKVVGRYWCAPAEIAVRLDAGDVFRSKDEKYIGAKFLIRQTAAYPIVGPHEHATHFRNSLHALYQPEEGVDVRYLVGMLNSKVIRFAYARMVRESGQRAFPQVKLTPLGMLPVRAVDLSVPSEKAAHDRIVKFVEDLLAVNRKLFGERNPDRIETLRHQADALDSSLDHEIYALYDLTEAEVTEIEELVSALAPPPPVPA